MRCVSRPSSSRAASSFRTVADETFEAVLPDERRRRHRLGRGDVLADDGAQAGRAAARRAVGADRSFEAFSTLPSRVLKGVPRLGGPRQACVWRVGPVSAHLRAPRACAAGLVGLVTLAYSPGPWNPPCCLPRRRRGGPSDGVRVQAVSAQSECPRTRTPSSSASRSRRSSTHSSKTSSCRRGLVFGGVDFKPLHRPLGEELSEFEGGAGCGRGDDQLRRVHQHGDTTFIIVAFVVFLIARSFVPKAAQTKVCSFCGERSSTPRRAAATAPATNDDRNANGIARTAVGESSSLATRALAHADLGIASRARPQSQRAERRHTGVVEISARTQANGSSSSNAFVT